MPTLPASHSFCTSPKPLTISFCSCSFRMPALRSAFENAIDPLTSAAYMRLSYLRDWLNSCMLSVSQVRSHAGAQ